MARKRRGRGEGSIFQREEDGLWVSSVSLGYTAEGKRRRKTVYGTTKVEVQEKLRALHGAGPRTPTGPVTLSRFLASWLAKVKPEVEPTTYAGYEQHVRLHIGPRVGGVKLADLTSVHVEELRDELLNDGVSKAMVKKVLVTLRTGLNYATGKRPPLIPFNPALSVRPPKVPRYRPTVFTPDQVRAFLKAAADDWFEVLYLVAIDSGCRQGELLALRWTDFDPKAGTVTVTKALAELSGRRWEKDAKTERSRRTVALVLGLDALAGHRERLRARGFDVGAGLMFPAPRGGEVAKSNLLNRFSPTLKRAGLPKIRFHDLRHCCASLMLAAGVDTKVVSERLGHSTPGFTAQVYQHVLPGMQAQAAGKLRDLLADRGWEEGRF